MTEMELLQRVVSHLIAAGYPRDRVIIEYNIPSSDGRRYQCRADIAVLDRNGVVPVALFELKCDGNIRSYESALNQLKYYVAQLRHPVRTYFVCPADNKSGIAFVDATADSSGQEADSRRAYVESDLSSEVASYEELVNASELACQNKQDQKVQKFERHVDELKISCWVLIAILFILFFRDYYAAGFRVHWESLSILLGIIILALLPYCDIVFNGTSITRREAHGKGGDSYPRTA